MIIKGNRVYVDNRFIPAEIEIKEGKITRIIPDGSLECDYDYKELMVLPGFIDIHTHGSYGFDTNDGEEEGLKDWMARIPEEGVTSILPTTVTQTSKVLCNALKNVANVVKSGYTGAEILGVHLEGPFIDMSQKGAQPPEAIIEPSVDKFVEFQNAAEGLIRYITLSPEHDKDYKLTKHCVNNNVTVSAGHSAAIYATMLEAKENGVTSMTHVYNGMTGLHHREPGMVGAALAIGDLFGEIIGDGMHVCKEAVKIFCTMKGEDKVILITDSLRAKHCPKGGVYDLGGHEIEIDENGLARLKGTNTIAGSTLSMNKGLKFLVQEVGVPLSFAVKAATINPAKAIHADDRKGKIAEGYDADITVLNDDFDVIETFCRGVLAYNQK